MGRYSHSKLSTFEQCKRKYKYRYIDKIIPEIEKSIEAVLGTAVHDTLEWIYISAKEGNPPILDDVIMHYSEQWKKEFSPDVLIVKKELTEKDYFNKGVQFLVSYFQKHHPFDDGTLELEKKITLTLGENNEHEIVGFIDRLVKNKETSQFEVHDYKTANTLPSQEKMDQDRQLALYSIAIKEEHGNENEVLLVWHYLAHDKKITSKRTDQQLENLKREILELIAQIEATSEFPANKTRLCDWCEYKDMCKKESTQESKPKQEQQITIDLEKYPTVSKYLKD